MDTIAGPIVSLLALIGGVTLLVLIIRAAQGKTGEAMNSSIQMQSEVLEKQNEAVEMFKEELGIHKEMLAELKRLNANLENR